MAWGSFGLVLAGNLTLTEVAPFVNQIRDLLKLNNRDAVQMDGVPCLGGEEKLTPSIIWTSNCL